MNINTFDNGSDLIISHSMLCTSCAFFNTADFTHLKPQHVRNIKMHKEHLEQGRYHTQEEMILQNMVQNHLLNCMLNQWHVHLLAWRASWSSLSRCLMCELRSFFSKRKVFFSACRVATRSCSPSTSVHFNFSSSSSFLQRMHT